MYNLLKYVYTNLGIDLGTANTVVFAERKGYIVNQPSVIAFNKKYEVIAYGLEAKDMKGKTGDRIRVSADKGVQRGREPQQNQQGHQTKGGCYPEDKSAFEHGKTS